MEVYIEYVLIDNLIINTLIAYLTLKTLNIRFVKWKVLLASILGTAFAVVMPLVNINTYLLLFLKVVLGMTMALIIAKPKSTLNYILTFTLFVTYTFVLGGACFGLMFIVNPNVHITNMLVLGLSFPISIYILLLFIYIYILIKAVSIVRQKAGTRQHVFRLIIKQNNQTYHTNAFLDTGNKLYDNSKPVLVLNQKLFMKIFKDVSYMQLMLNKLDNSQVNDLSFINASSLDSQKKLPVFSLDEIILNNKCFKGARATVTLSNFNDEFDCILHPEFIDT